MVVFVQLDQAGGTVSTEPLARDRNTLVHSRLVRTIPSFSNRAGHDQLERQGGAVR